MVQMNVEDTAFFEMIHRHSQFRKNNRASILKSKRPENMLFEAKKDMVAIKKINILPNMYLFFKQCLRMVINSLTVMISCIDNSKIQRMI